MKWRACSKGMIYDVGDGFVVYFNPRSGKTHLINEVAAWLLEELVTTHLTTDQMCDRVVDLSMDISPLEVEKLVANLIQELQSFDLVEAI